MESLPQKNPRMSESQENIFQRGRYTTNQYIYIYILDPHQPPSINQKTNHQAENNENNASHSTSSADLPSVGSLANDTQQHCARLQIPHRVMEADGIRWLSCWGPGLGNLRKKTIMICINIYIYIYIHIYIYVYTYMYVYI